MLSATYAQVDRWPHVKTGARVWRRWCPGNAAGHKLNVYRDRCAFCEFYVGLIVCFWLTLGGETLVRVHWLARSIISEFDSLEWVKLSALTVARGEE